MSGFFKIKFLEFQESYLCISKKCTLLALIPPTPLYSVEELKDSTNHSVWSKTTLITGGVSGAGVYAPTCKMGTSFLTKSKT